MMSVFEIVYGKIMSSKNNNSLKNFRSIQSMIIPYVTFKPMEAELDKELRDAFNRAFTRSWYIC